MCLLNSFSPSLTAQDSMTIAHLEDELGQMAFDYEALTTQPVSNYFYALHFLIWDLFQASSWNRKQLEKLSELMRNHAEKVGLDVSLSSFLISHLFVCLL